MAEFYVDEDTDILYYRKDDSTSFRGGASGRKRDKSGRCIKRRRS